MVAAADDTAMESVAEEIMRDILLKLSTRDVARCVCVCKPWRRIIRDPSFRLLHGKARHVVCGSGSPEALLISETKPPGMTRETTVFNVSSVKLTPMCRITDLDDGWVTSIIVCNGFLLFKSGDYELIFVCNPVTSEKLQVPTPPFGINHWGRRLLAMGFCASGHQYKLFHFLGLSEYENSLDVYSLGGGGWRRHQDHIRFYSARSPPALISGKLYVITLSFYTRPDKMLVIDVESETHHMCSLPHSEFHKVEMDALELHGRPSVALHVLDTSRVSLNLWVMPVEGDGWELRYSFYSDRPFKYPHDDKRRCIWIDDDGMLCFVMDDHLYKYNTTKEHEEMVSGRLLAWDYKLQLPSPFVNREWTILVGYRPTLLSLNILPYSRTTMVRTARILSIPGYVPCEAINLTNDPALQAQTTAMTSILPREEDLSLGYFEI